jgi:hypothetical protein
MKPQIIGLRIAGTLFGLMALVQLTRLMLRESIFIGVHQLPLWPSALAFVVLAGLCLWLWKLSKQAT